MFQASVHARSRTAYARTDTLTCTRRRHGDIAKLHFYSMVSVKLLATDSRSDFLWFCLRWKQTDLESVAEDRPTDSTMVDSYSLWNGDRVVCQEGQVLHRTRGGDMNAADHSSSPEFTPTPAQVKLFNPISCTTFDCAQKDVIFKRICHAFRQNLAPSERKPESRGEMRGTISLKINNRGIAFPLNLK